MSDSSRASWLLVIALAGGAAGYFWLRPGPGVAPPPEPTVAPWAGSPSGPVPAPVPATTVPARSADSPPAPSLGRILYPDGSEQPALNGVEEPVKVAWPPNVPFAPIVDRFVDPDGLHWYRHADGSQSTTKLVWRQDLGRHAAMGWVTNPTAAAPALVAEPAGSGRRSSGDQKKN